MPNITISLIFSRGQSEDSAKCSNIWSSGWGPGCCGQCGCSVDCGGDCSDDSDKEKKTQPSGCNQIRYIIQVMYADRDDEAG